MRDVRHLPVLSPSTVRVWDEPEQLSEIGQTFSHEVRFAGRCWTTTWLVSAVEAGHSLTLDGQAGGARYSLAQELTPVGTDRTGYRLTMAYRVPGGPLGWLVRRAGVDRYARAEALQVASALKDLVEGGTAPTAKGSEVPETQR